MSKNNIKLIMENWNSFVREQEEDEPESFESDDGKEMSFSDEEIKDFDDKESRAERWTKGTGQEVAVSAVQVLGYGTSGFFGSLLHEFPHNHTIMQKNLQDAIDEVGNNPKKFPRNAQQLSGALKEALANAKKLEAIIRKITSRPEDGNPFASAQARAGDAGISAQDAIGGAPPADKDMDDMRFPKLKENQDPIKQKEAMIKKLQKQHAAEKDPKKKAALKKKLEKLKADLAGPSGNPDQKKPVKEQVTDEELKNTKPQCKKEGNYVVCTIKHKGKTVKGKGKIRLGNLGMAKTTAETRARQALARAIAQEPGTK